MHVLPAHPPTQDRRLDDEKSTNDTRYTPTESNFEMLDSDAQRGSNDTKDLASSVPWPDHTYILSVRSSREVLKLLDGDVILAPLGGRGSIHWECFENKGWFGFKNVDSGRLLGHDQKGALWCELKAHNPWESFVPRARPDGGYDLMMMHKDGLVPVGMKNFGNGEKLAKIEDRKGLAIAWEFTKV